MRLPRTPPRRLPVLLITLIALTAAPAAAQPFEYTGFEPLGTSSISDYQMPEPVDTTASAFGARFGSEADRQDFKRLREFLSERESMRREVAAQLGRYQATYRELRALLHDYEFAIARQQRTRADAGGADTTLERLQAERAQGDSIMNAYLREIRKLELKRGIIDREIERTQRAIDAALAPEYARQDFRTSISLYFSALIAVLIIAFFLVIYFRGTADLSTLLLADGGLQFVTIFVLIIAVILFGILGVLEGRELAAILSGIAGYILGRGNRTGFLAPPAPADPQAVVQPAPARALIGNGGAGPNPAVQQS